ncbi:MAG: GIY-YIG nuclease family protein [Patescibacteria group bacterium]|nr:GIY-YIG nuclease family protein [Patescibacteria group bacterium]
MKNKIKNFPDTPGVYRFLDKKRGVLYIGRAGSLKKRISQYFRKDLEPRIEEMVTQANDIKYEKTETILDSVILEANLIKKFWPKYNVRDRDDRSFIYIVIAKGDYPYPFIVRGRQLKKFPKSKAYIFGPYQAQHLLRGALRIIRRLFPYSTCRPKQGRPCFDYQIGLCPGICVGEVSRAKYKNNIKNIILLLQGDKKRLVKKLAKENPDLIASLKHISDASLISRDDFGMAGLSRIEGYDISHLAGKEPYGSMVVFSNGQADKSQYRLFKIKSAPAADDLRALVEVLTRRFNHHEWPQPDIIMLDGGRPQVDFVDNFFKLKNIRVPIVGISKLAGDKLVYTRGADKQFKQLTDSIKNILLQSREEAHRFSRQASRRSRQY